MNILNVLPSPDGVGGTERSAHLGAYALMAAGHRVFLLHGEKETAKYGEQYTDQIGFPVLFDRRSISEPQGLRDAELNLGSYIEQNRIEVMHVQGWPRSSILERWSKRYAVVATTHVALCPNFSRYQWKGRIACERKISFACLTTGYMQKGCGHLGNGQPYGLPGFIRGMTDDFILRRALGRCARVIAPSNWIKGRLMKDGMPEEIIRILPPPIANSLYASEMDQEKNPPIVMFVGRLMDFKGPDHLLKASAIMTHLHQVWIIGDGPMRDALESLADELGIRARVTFFGSLQPEKINALRIQSTVMAVPSLWPDNFPMVGPEALLLRRPVVAYRVGGIPEWLKDNLNGHLVEPGDVAGLAQAIEDILSKPDLAYSMGQAGFDLASNWVPERHALTLEKIYCEAKRAFAEIGSKN